MNSTEGNCATFLLKVEGVLEGLFQDMIMVGSSEAKVSSVLNLLICDIPDMLHCILPDKSTQICAGEQAPHISPCRYPTSCMAITSRASSASNKPAYYPTITSSDQYDRGVPDLFFTITTGKDEENS